MRAIDAPGLNPTGGMPIPEAMPASSTTTAPGRMPALDGLRGVAALVVVVFHSVMMIPAIALAAAGPDHGHSAFVSLVTYTPLHVLWAGPEAVAVFFVLSGFVLTRSADSARFAWRAYYPSRLLRLYLPVAGALAFAAVLFAAVPRPSLNGISVFEARLIQIPVGARNVAHDFLVVKGQDNVLPVLWSLKWEVIFSLLLPLAVYGASRRLVLAVPTAAFLLFVSAQGQETASRRGYLLYLPMFGIGALMARQDDRFRHLGRLVSGPTAATAALIAAAALLTGPWIVHRQDTADVYGLTIAGAAGFVFLFGYSRPFAKAGDRRVTRWLAKRSFSLYLVHWPIVLGAAMLLGTHASWAFAPAIPLSLITADLFYRACEGPSHRLSQAVKRRLTPAAARPRVGPARDLTTAP